VVVLSLGTNLGDRFSNMDILEKKVAKLLGGSLRKSPLYETEPIGVDESHSHYLNRIIAGEYDGTAWQLLAETQRIESELGRVGKGTLAPRTADIDILLYNDRVIHTEHIVIPHHALFERHFEIAGVQAVVPDMRIPGMDILFGDYEIPTSVKNQVIKEIQ